MFEWPSRFMHFVILILLAVSISGCERPAPVDTEASPTSTPLSETAVSTPTTAPTQTPESVDTPRDEADTPTPEVEPTVEGADSSNEETDTPPSEATTIPEATEESTEPTSEQPTAEPATEETADLPETHTVTAGETLYQIGLQYGISWVTLAEINNISTPNQLLVGQEIVLQRDLGNPAPTPSPNTETTHVVQPGENLFRIGLQYGMTWTQIAEANGLVNPNQIEVGQVLKIPVSVSGPLPEFLHTVQQNETLLTISLLYGVPWQAIAQTNEIASPYLIFPGQQLTIPSS